jgi:hypothetical protein
MLRRRLTRRGVSFPAALVGLGLGATAAPAALVSATVNAAVPLAGQTAAGVSAVTVQVAEGVCRAMVMHRIRGAGIALGLALLTALGGVAIVPGVDGPAQSAAAGDTPSKESPKADAAGPAADPGIKDADPEKLFKRMEQRLLTCKTLDVQMEFAGVAEKDVKGRLLVARGNKMRLEFDMTAAGRPHKATTVSDGARMRTIGAIPRLNDQTPKQLTEIVLSSVTRGGVWLTMAELLEKQDPATESKDFDLEKSLAVSDFKLGTKEQVAGREAQVIEYKVKTADEPLVMTVWIDVRTDLPLKRVVKGKDKDGPYQVLMTETYTKVGVDEKIDDKVFEVPK